jgi:hypothetical protein
MNVTALPSRLQQNSLSHDQGPQTFLKKGDFNFDTFSSPTRCVARVKKLLTGVER